jgi:hypothetical protein
MGALYIFTQISETRVQTAGQPQIETIECENYLSLPPLIQEPYVETVRFADPLQAGGLPVRYYHLLNRVQGCTLCLDALGKGRLMYGFYHTRDLICSTKGILSLEQSSPCANMISLGSLSMASHMIVSCPGNHSVLRVNCIEHYLDKIVFHSSFSVPNILLAGSPSYSQLNQCDSAMATSSAAGAFHVQSELVDSRASLTLVLKENNLYIVQDCFKIMINSSVLVLTPLSISFV